MNQQSPFFTASTDSLEESLMPRTENEAEIIFGAATVRLGEADLPHPGQHDIEEQGMIMGPRHPIFQNQKQKQRENFPSSTDLPVPPGARFDPISPVGPGFYSPGGPDFDELLPPGAPVDPLAHTVKPPLKPKSGSATFRAPFGHPHGAPPGSNNSPFFM